MIKLHTGRRPHETVTADFDCKALPDGVVWIDVMQPTEADAGFVERLTGIKLPTFASLSEVESSSRLRSDDGILYLSLPVLYRLADGEPRASPVGLVLSGAQLVTVRFADLKSFETFRERLDRREFSHPTSCGVLIALLEAMVDRLADVLEEVGGGLDQVADHVFKATGGPSGASPKQEDRKLRATLRRVGRDRQLISKARATLLGIGRIVPYVQSEGAEWLPDHAKAQLDTVGHDVASLDEYEVHLSDKIQFLLDAALGLINIQQNDTFRVLTIVSVVGIPPTLVASMYGMNFKTMPELDWSWGYGYGLAVIAISAIVPIAYFKVKGWF